MCPLPRRAYHEASQATLWRPWEETGPYAERVSELLEKAKHHVIITGWQIDSRYPLSDPSGNRETLGQKLTRICRQNPDFRAYLLLWSHASFYAFEREKFQRRTWSKLHPRIHFVFDALHPLGASHHEKLILIDGSTAFCGGIDLCDRRLDYPEHHWSDIRRSLNRRSEKHGPYHDRAVEVEGDIVEVLYRHAHQRWARASGIPFPQIHFEKSLHPQKKHQIYFSRTASYPKNSFHFSRRNKQKNKNRTRRLDIIKENERLHLTLIRLAQHELVIEGQYYWSKRINRALIRRLYQRAGSSFQVTLILTDLTQLRALTRQMAAHGYYLLSELQTACEKTGARLQVIHPLIRHPDSPFHAKPKSVYVHSKLILVDDRYLSIGSTNIAARAFRVDSEVNLTLEALTPPERKELRHFRNSLMEHWGLKKNSIYPFHDFKKSSPLKDLQHWFQTHLFLTQIPWSFFFDPEEPWIRTVEKRLHPQLKNILSRFHSLVS